jgi:hypothetical protein
MNTQIIAILMFLLLAYLLFRRPASAASRQCPTELNFQVGHSIYLPNEILEKKTVSPHGLGDVNRHFPQGGALAFAPVLPSGALANAQSPTVPQDQLADVGDVSNAGKED